MAPRPRIRINSLLLLAMPLCTLAQSAVEGATRPGPDPYDNYRDWAIYRGDKRANQYSELDQIHSGNMRLLRPVWEYRHGDPNGPSMYSNRSSSEHRPPARRRSKVHSQPQSSPPSHSAFQYRPDSQLAKINGCV